MAGFGNSSESEISEGPFSIESIQSLLRMETGKNQMRYLFFFESGFGSFF